MEPRVWTLMRTGTLRSRFSKTHCEVGERKREKKKVSFMNCCRQVQSVLQLLQLQPNKYLGARGAHDRFVEMPIDKNLKNDINHFFFFSLAFVFSEVSVQASPFQDALIGQALPCIHTRMCHDCSPARLAEASPSRSSGCSVPQSSEPPLHELLQDLLETNKIACSFKNCNCPQLFPRPWSIGLCSYLAWVLCIWSAAQHRWTFPRTFPDWSLQELQAHHNQGQHHWLQRPR